MISSIIGFFSSKCRKAGFFLFVCFLILFCFFTLTNLHFGLLLFLIIFFNRPSSLVSAASSSSFTAAASLISSLRQHSSAERFSIRLIITFLTACFSLKPEYLRETAAFAHTAPLTLCDTLLLAAGQAHVSTTCTVYVCLHSPQRLGSSPYLHETCEVYMAGGSLPGCSAVSAASITSGLCRSTGGTVMSSI